MRLIHPQMTTNLGYLLGGITAEGRPLTRWYRLNRRGKANMYGGYQHQRQEGDVCCRWGVIGQGGEPAVVWIWNHYSGHHCRSAFFRHLAQPSLPALPVNNQLQTTRDCGNA